MLQMLRRIQ